MTEFMLYLMSYFSSAFVIKYELVISTKLKALTYEFFCFYRSMINVKKTKNLPASDEEKKIDILKKYMGKVKI